MTAQDRIASAVTGIANHLREHPADGSSNDAQATVFDTEVICLEIGDTCSGGACPVGAMSVDAMDARLAKSGLSPSVRRTVLAPCGGCDRTTELVVSSGG